MAAPASTQRSANPRSARGPGRRDAEHVDRAAVLERLDGRERVGVGADRCRRARADRAMAASTASGRLQLTSRAASGMSSSGLRGGGQRLAAAQPRRAVVGQRPREPDGLAALGGRDRSCARLLGRGHRLAEHEIDAIGLLGDDPAVDAERLLEGDRQRRVIAAEERREAAGDAHLVSPPRASRAACARSSARCCSGSNISPRPRGRAARAWRRRS